jgi:flagellar biosynthesis protein FlhF
MEIIDDKIVCALIGPSGVGKTTTIAKMANRYVERYGAESIALITVDNQDIYIKSQLSYYSQKLNITLSYAHDANELAQAIERLKYKKNVILIDTNGFGQNDQANITQLINDLHSQKVDVKQYLTLPCNLQASTYNSIISAYDNPKLAGTILTKQDESDNLAPVISAGINHQLPIAYVNAGQNITGGIAYPEGEHFTNTLFPQRDEQYNN